MAILGPGNGTLENGALTNVTSIPSFIATGTRMIFEQTAAPTSWVKETTLGNNRSLRVTTGTAAPGGTVAFDTVFVAARAVTGTNVAVAAGGAVAQNVSAGSVVSNGANIDANSLSVAQLASHTHGYTRNSLNLRGTPLAQGAAQVCVAPEIGDTTGGNGSNGAHGHGSPAHGHGFTHLQHAHGFTGTSHNHTWSGSTNLDVLYLDVIVAAKS